jgi:hypothetical protein
MMIFPQMNGPRSAPLDRTAARATICFDFAVLGRNGPVKSNRAARQNA